MSALRMPRVAIVGAGMSGICMAVQLQTSGITNFVVFEKADSVGGTWRDNTYPGLACDVPSRFYQFSFAPNPEWSSLFSSGSEIWGYFDDVVDRFGIRHRFRLRTEIESAEYLDGQWRVETSDGDRQEFDFLISATGILHHPRYPSLDSIETFAGDMFHSARWDHSVPTEGRRVGVIGTGSTGAQIVSALPDMAGSVTLFQRTAQWLLPFGNHKTSRFVRWAHRRVPALNRVSYHFWRMVFEAFTPALTQPGLRRRLIQWLSRTYLLRKVVDPELRRKLTPDYQPGCKRLVVSTAYYDALQRDNVELVSEGIERIESNGVRTTDGRLHELDVLVLATGFDSHAYMRPMRLVGCNGLTIDEVWEQRPVAYQTVAIPGFPNFFMLMGPNSPVGNYSLTAIAEAQGEHILHWIGEWRRGRVNSVSPLPHATERFNEEIREAMPGTVWASGCDSWYIGKDGQPELFPWPPRKHRHMLRYIKRNDFLVEAPGDPRHQ